MPNSSINNDIDSFEGGDGKRIGMLRSVDEELHGALQKPLSPSESKNREIDQKIAERLVDHGYSKNEIREVIHFKNPRDKTSIRTEDSYFESVLTDAGYDPSDHYTDSDDSLMTDSDDDDHDDVDPSDFSHITFDNASSSDRFDGFDIPDPDNSTSSNHHWTGDQEDFIDNIVTTLNEGESVTDVFADFDSAVRNSPINSNASELEDEINRRNNAN